MFKFYCRLVNNFHVIANLSDVFIFYSTKINLQVTFARQNVHIASLVFSIYTLPGHINIHIAFCAITQTGVGTRFALLFASSLQCVYTACYLQCVSNVSTYCITCFYLQTLLYFVLPLP